MAIPLHAKICVAAPWLLAAPLAAQNTYFSEDFDGAFPPPGWHVVNENGHSGTGWQQSPGLRAWVDGWNQRPVEESLETRGGLVDLRGVSGPVFLHVRNEIVDVFATDGISDVNVSVDGGFTWANVWTETRQHDGREDTVIDLSPLAGRTIDLQFYYWGDHDHSVYYDDVLVTDEPRPRPDAFPIPNLPASFAAAPFVEDFESLGGIPPHMALNAMDPAFQDGYPFAWCDVGGNYFPPHSGSGALEMGGNPSYSPGPEVKNAMVLGIDGNGINDLELDAYFVRFAENVDHFDGIWVSQDGRYWFPVMPAGSWRSFLAQSGVWEKKQVDLSATHVDTGGHFYLMIAQADNWTFATLDGVGVDDLLVQSASAGGFSLTVQGTCPGYVAIEVAGATPRSQVALLVGPAGDSVVPGGRCAGVTLDLQRPHFVVLGTDGWGRTSFHPRLPAAACGALVQALDLATCDLSNTWRL